MWTKAPRQTNLLTGAHGESREREGSKRCRISLESSLSLLVPSSSPVLFLVRFALAMFLFIKSYLSFWAPAVIWKFKLQWEVLPSLFLSVFCLSNSKTTFSSILSSVVRARLLWFSNLKVGVCTYMYMLPADVSVLLLLLVLTRLSLQRRTVTLY